MMMSIVALAEMNNLKCLMDSTMPRKVMMVCDLSELLLSKGKQGHLCVFGYVSNSFISDLAILVAMYACMVQGLPVCHQRMLKRIDVTVFHSFILKIGKTFMNSQQIMLLQPGRPMFLFSKNTEQFSGEEAW